MFPVITACQEYYETLLNRLKGVFAKNSYHLSLSGEALLGLRLSRP